MNQSINHLQERELAQSIGFIDRELYLAQDEDKFVALEHQLAQALEKMLKHVTATSKYSK